MKRSEQLLVQQVLDALDHIVLQNQLVFISRDSTKVNGWFVLLEPTGLAYWVSNPTSDMNESCDVFIADVKITDTCYAEIYPTTVRTI